MNAFPRRDTLSFRYTRRPSTSYCPLRQRQPSSNSNNTGLFGSTPNTTATLAGLTYTRLFRPTLINELRLGFTRTAVDDAGAFQGTDYNALFGIAGGTTDPHLIGFPEIVLSGYQQLGPGNNFPMCISSIRCPLGDTLTWVKGSHLVKAGIDVLHTQTIDAYVNNSRGTYNFTGYWTGQPYADFLLGYLNSASRLVESTVNHLLVHELWLFRAGRLESAQPAHPQSRPALGDQQASGGQRRAAQ